jgi:hypothetical protein
MKKSLLLAALLLNAGIATAADTASWTLWSNNLTGTFSQNSNTINVTYTGQNFGIDTNSYIFNAVPTSFTSPTVTNTPGGNGTIAMTGGTDGINNFHFSQAVIDPLIAVWSVGQGGVPVTFNFLNSAPFSILSQGAGAWGGGTVTQTEYSITGLEGNALLQFKGSYTDLYFTTPNYEYYYGITVGALLAPVPEPETNAMLLAGLGLMGAIGRRRKNRTA